MSGALPRCWAVSGKLARTVPSIKARPRPPPLVEAASCTTDQLRGEPPEPCGRWVSSPRKHRIIFAQPSSGFLIVASRQLFLA